MALGRGTWYTVAGRWATIRRRNDPRMTAHPKEDQDGPPAKPKPSPEHRLLQGKRWAKGGTNISLVEKPRRDMGFSPCAAPEVQCPARAEVNQSCFNPTCPLYYKSGHMSRLNLWDGRTHKVLGPEVGTWTSNRGWTWGNSNGPEAGNWTPGICLLSPFLKTPTLRPSIPSTIGTQESLDLPSRPQFFHSEQEPKGLALSPCAF